MIKSHNTNNMSKADDQNVVPSLDTTNGFGPVDTKLRALDRSAPYGLNLDFDSWAEYPTATSFVIPDKDTRNPTVSLKLTNNKVSEIVLHDAHPKVNQSWWGNYASWVIPTLEFDLARGQKISNELKEMVNHLQASNSLKMHSEPYEWEKSEQHGASECASKSNGHVIFTATRMAENGPIFLAAKYIKAEAASESH